MPIDDLMIKIQNITKKYFNCMSNELLKPLNDLFTWELDALLGLFSCFHHLNHFRYLESLMEVSILQISIKYAYAYIPNL